MPYKIFKDGSGWAVWKVDEGGTKVHKKHTYTGARARARAIKYLQALYAAENKDMTEPVADNTSTVTASEPMDEKDYYGVETHAVGFTSFADLDTWRSQQEAANQRIDITYDYKMILDNILSSDLVEDKEAAIISVTKEYTSRLENPPPDEKETAVKEVWTTAYINTLPDSAFLFVESGGKKDSEGKTVPRGKRHFPYKDKNGNIDLPHLRNAIARIPQSNAPGLNKAALQKRAQGLLKRANRSKGLVETAIDTVKEAFGMSDPEVDRPIMLWKEREDGPMHFIARYSNNFRDDDEPSEIISEKSHRRFVDLVDSGRAEYPELWLWHVPEWSLGQTTWVGYDDSGFALAAGVVDKEAEPLVEWIAKQPDVALSHGMPVTTIRRDPDDPSVIVEHETKELSLLPFERAANKLTSFVTIPVATKEDNVSIPKHKKDALTDPEKGWGINPEVLDELEERNKADAEKATAEGVERKEAAEEVETEPAAEAETTTETEATNVDQTPTPVPSVQEIATAVMGILDEYTKPLREQQAATEAAIKELTERLEKSTAAEQDEIKETLRNTPVGSLGALLSQQMSVLSSNEAKIRSNDPLTKEKPAETEAEAGRSIIGIPMLDKIMADGK